MTAERGAYMKYKRLIWLACLCGAAVLGCSSEGQSSDGSESVEQEDSVFVASSDSVLEESGNSEVATSVQEQTGGAATTKKAPTEDSSASSPEVLNLLNTAFVDSSDYWGVQPYAEQANQLGIQFHNGFDYFTNQEEVGLQAVSDGRVMFVEIFERPPDGAFQINLAWQAPSGEIVSYSLEPSAGPANETKIAEQKVLADKMMKAITIKAGDVVSQGQFLGYLYGQDEWAHVHMTVKASSQGPEKWLCPADFMATLNGSDLLAKSLVWAEGLYKGSKQPQLCNY